MAVLLYISCEPPRVRHSDIYRSRFHPISAVLLTLILLRLWLCWLLTCSDCSQLFLKVLTLNLTEQRRGPSAVSGNKWWQGGPLYRSAACLFLPVFSCLSPPTLFTFYSGVSAVSIKISFTKTLQKAGADHSFVQNIFHKEFKIFSDVEFCSLTPFFVCSCSRFSLTFQFLPQKLTNISFKKLSPLELQAHYFFHKGENFSLKYNKSFSFPYDDVDSSSSKCNLLNAKLAASIMKVCGRFGHWSYNCRSQTSG